MVRRAGEPVGVGTVALSPDRSGWVLEHACVAPDADDRTASAVVLEALGSVGPSATVHLPAPHPAVPPLLRTGWRVTEHDLFMATDASLLDPRRAVPSPSLA